MTALVFVDTNVVVYALGKGGDKQERAWQTLEQAPTISAQVVNETISVLLGKQKFTPDEAYEVGEALIKMCRVLPLSESSVRLAIQLARRYSLSHWDANIIATALLAGCGTLYSEDMQDGQVFEGRLTVVNPFRMA
jgi:predicted nucleic acid-binding protein